ncbi:hypothetical protein J2R96_002221 [Bradyrhizobium elkanii]|nr:hypothetical protein [Bradyrhizobium elkanii]
MSRALGNFDAHQGGRIGRPTARSMVWNIRSRRDQCPTDGRSASVRIPTLRPSAAPAGWRARSNRRRTSSFPVDGVRLGNVPVEACEVFDRQNVRRGSRKRSRSASLGVIMWRNPGEVGSLEVEFSREQQAVREALPSDCRQCLAQAETPGCLSGAARPHPRCVRASCCVPPFVARRSCSRRRDACCQGMACLVKFAGTTRPAEKALTPRISSISSCSNCTRGQTRRNAPLFQGHLPNGQAYNGACFPGMWSSNRRSLANWISPRSSLTTLRTAARSPAWLSDKQATSLRGGQVLRSHRVKRCGRPTV